MHRLLSPLAIASAASCADAVPVVDARCDVAPPTDRRVIADAPRERVDLAVGLPVFDAPPPLLDASARPHDAASDAGDAGDDRAPPMCERCSPPGAALCDGRLARVCVDASPWPCWRESDCGALQSACSPYRPDAGSSALSPLHYCLNPCGGRGRALTHPLDAPVEGLPCARYVCDVERGDTRPSHTACRRVGEPCEAAPQCESARCERGTCAPR